MVPPVPPTDPDAATALTMPRAPRPPGWLGPACVAAPPAVGMALVSLGFEVSGKPIATALLLLMVFGFVESKRAFTGWLMARRTRAHGIVVKRGVLRPVVLCLPVRDGATAVRGQVLFAATNDLVWRVSLPRVDIVEFTVARRGLLSSTRYVIDGGDFDAAFVVDSSDDALSVVSRLGPPVRRAIRGLFVGTTARRVRFTATAVEVEFPRRGNDVDPVVSALALLAVLADAVDAPPVMPAHLLRAHSPGGGSTGF
jgi:hypothetical protein